MNKVKVKSWFHLVLLSIVVAGAAYVAIRQNVSITEKIGAFGVLLAASLMALGKVLPTVDSAIDAIPDDEPKLPKPSPNTPVICLLALGSLLIAGQARAAVPPQALGCVDTANTYCVVPASALGWQINLKTGGMKNAVSLLGLTLQHTFGSLPVGAGLYLGLGADAGESKGSYQGCFGASITNWGLLCLGAQRLIGESVWQGMLTFAGQLTQGGTPSYVASQGAR